eukprot:3123359-Rhodomonas_salina.1
MRCTIQGSLPDNSRPPDAGPPPGSTKCRVNVGHVAASAYRRHLTYARRLHVVGTPTHTSAPLAPSPRRPRAPSLLTRLSRADR